MHKNHKKRQAGSPACLGKSEGNYGAGTVMIWDRGTYKNIKKQSGAEVPMKECLKNGQIEVWLGGEKLQGDYVLIEIRKQKNLWLLKKMDDERIKKG